jgi:8-oxo-dGTP pyrophosphatase MutT (NUDIX family)
MKVDALHNDQNIFPRPSQLQCEAFSTRQTVKAIVLNRAHMIAMVGVRENAFLLFPGGGVEGDETIVEAVKRECLEEIGCRLEIGGYVGSVVDYRARKCEKCITQCFWGWAFGHSVMPKLTAEEKQIGMYVTWKSVDDVLRIFDRQLTLLRQGKCAFYNTGFNIARDAALFRKFEATIYRKMAGDQNPSTQ